MSDPRFTTDVSDVEALLRIVDIDTLDDVETLLMFLFARPVTVMDTRYVDGDEPVLEVVVRGDDATVGFIHEFPLSVIDLVRSCAHVVDDLGPYRAGHPQTEDTPNVLELNDGELITALERALGMVRIFNKMEDEETTQ